MLGAVASGAAASVLGSPEGKARAADGPKSDADVLTRTLQIEHLLVVAYRRVLASGALAPDVARQIGAMLGQELEHVAILRRELRRLGAPVPAAPASLVAAQRALAAHHVYTSLAELRTQNICLKLLIDVESVAEGAYFDAIGALTDPVLLRAGAGIMGCEAQHWTVLSAIRHHGDPTISVPYPFVRGST